MNCARLSMDSGYLSRLLRALETQGLTKSRPSAADARVRPVTLTAKGRRDVDELERRSQESAAPLLAPLGESHRKRLIAAMAEVERLMRAAAVVVEVSDPAGEQARTCIDAYLREIDSGLMRASIPLVARLPIRMNLCRRLVCSCLLGWTRSR